MGKVLYVEGPTDVDVMVSFPHQLLQGDGVPGSHVTASMAPDPVLIR